MKVLLVVAVVAVVVALLLGRRRQDASEAARPPRRAGGEPLQMVSCARCGVHLPEGEALRDAAGRAYCSETHRRAGPT